MRTGPYPDLFDADFFAMPMALSSAWMDLFFMPMRLSMGLMGTAPLPHSPTAQSHTPKSIRSQSETDKILAQAEDELAGIDGAHHDTDVNLSALLS